ncbi:MAG: penicillin-binding protein 2 [Gammaproteobacteria bacterium]|nr:penicillin-binding protein 2 [Gammaproteobacteria bacterium]
MEKIRQYRWRLALVIFLFGAVVFGIIWRLIDLSILNRSFLLTQSKARILRKVSIPSSRGIITDRLGYPLAVSTPVVSVWANPKEFAANYHQLIKLHELLHLSVHYIQRRTRKKAEREFIYLKRRIPPSLGEKIKALKIPGIYLQREYKRYYPTGEVAAQVLGRTNVDDQGQEGLELGFNYWLRGSPGKKEVLKDRLGHVIADIALLKKPTQGHNLVLSIDHRIQYLAYRALKATVTRYHAKAGSVIVLDAKTGEVLAMVNQPSYNPNQPPRHHNDAFRNRAVTDSFEPGSTMKPFTISFALESGVYHPSSTINTAPGRMWVGGYLIKDDGLNYGVLTLQGILQKSSNIGAAKIMLSLQPQNFWHLLKDFGFGHRSQSGFPGEVAGSLVPRKNWYPSVVAALAYGYGVATTTLQLAHAYMVLADGGMKLPLSFLKLDKAPTGFRILKQKIADEVLDMLEAVVQRGGTGTRARVKAYHVAGKTGTAYIAGKKGYDKTKHIASFVGIAPVTDPRLVVAVVIREPKDNHYGGVVAAPVFARVMSGSLRLLNIAPDDLQDK